MSSFALFTAATAASLAIFAPLAAALDVPGGSNPTGGAVYTPGANSPVIAGQDYKITWAGATAGCGPTLDIVLLKGPSSTQMSALQYIAQKVDNTGSYTWSVPTTLEASPSDYAFETVCTDTQAYQYTGRFGIANAASSGSSSTSATGTTTSTPGNSSSSSTTSTSSSTRTTETPKYPIPGSNGTALATGGTVSVSTVTPATVTPTVTRTATGTDGGSGAASTASPTSSTTSTGAGAHVKAGFTGLLVAAAIAALTL